MEFVFHPLSARRGSDGVDVDDVVAVAQHYLGGRKYLLLLLHLLLLHLFLFLFHVLVHVVQLLLDRAADEAFRDVWVQQDGVSLGTN